jgi:hypothetical protein
MGRATDLTGQRFGLLTVVEQAPGRSANRSSLWACACDCGAERVMAATALRSGHTRSCGSGMHLNEPKGALKLRLVLSSYRGNALKRGIEWGLTEDEFIELVRAPCFYCGRGGIAAPVSLSSMVEPGGVDRFDNSLGYVPGNCVPCCQTCNTAKSSLTAEQFVAHCIAVAHRALKYAH